MKACNADATLPPAPRTSGLAATGGKTRIAIMASGRGSNAQALMEALLSGSHANLELVGVIADRPSAGVIERAQRLGVEVAVIARYNLPQLDRVERQRLHEERILDYLKERGVTLLLLAGYMRMIGPTLLDYFYDADLGVSRIVNIHPSLLPAFPGANGYFEAFQARAPFYGCTLHFIDRGMDSGPIIFQRRICLPEQHLYEELVTAGLREEHVLYRHFLDYWNRGIIQRSFTAATRPAQEVLSCQTLQ